MPVQFKLDHVIEETLAQNTQERRALRSLTGLNVSRSEAKTVWPLILDHKWYMSERLGRDVGLRVAAVDYFENIRSPREARAKKGLLAERMRRAMRPLMMGHRIA